jgi:hypothetical protein
MNQYQWSLVFGAFIVVVQALQELFVGLPLDLQFKSHILLTFVAIYDHKLSCNLLVIDKELGH